MTGRLRLGLIGLGEVTEAHLAGVPGNSAVVSAVCDSMRARAERLAKEYEVMAFSDYRELLASGLVDAVDIMLPHHLHEEVSMAAIELGIHVLVEKPAARSPAAIAELAARASRNGVMFAVAENTRFVEAYEAVGTLLSTGELGEVVAVRTAIAGDDGSHLGDPTDWRGRKALAVGGALFDGGAHSFYLLEWLFGGVASVGGVAATNTANSEVEDAAIAAGRLRRGGSYVTEFFFAVGMPWFERLEVYGSRASCVVDQVARPVVRLFRGPDDWAGQPVRGVTHDPSGWKLRSIARTVTDFVEAVESGRPHAVDLGDIRRAARVVEAAYSSIGRHAEEVPT